MSQPLPVAADVDLDRFMGAWFVQAHIPPPLTGGAFNAVETYTRVSEARVDAHYRYNKGSLDGPEKVMLAKGFVTAGTGNAIWRMQFLWPLKSDYRIGYLDDDYRETIIAREKRDYAWIMTRDQHISEEALAKLKERTEALGYRLDKLEIIPHSAS
ncbi:MAG: lipocalin family protein [Pseudomonadota bacterium]